MLTFKKSAPLTMGVELELQIVNSRDFNLTRGASDLLAAVAKVKHPGEIKPEITESMIEIATSVHMAHGPLAAELETLRAVLAAGAARLNLGIAGGGTHPFQQWHERRIYDTPRFKRVSDLYGALAKQFTVFGQHIHIGCAGGDEAVRLAHLLSRYMPHFIALSASSPFAQGADTRFDSSRLNVVNAFPLSGTMPYVRDWAAFNDYYDSMRGYGIVESMKDFYWDIRPKPEYGTVEIRVCDTPLTVGEAASLAAYAQALSRWLLVERPWEPDPNLYRVYGYNRFQACRFGFDATLVDPLSRKAGSLGEDLVATLAKVLPHAAKLGSGDALARLVQTVLAKTNGARRLRETFDKTESLSDVVRAAAALWIETGEAR